MADNTTDFSGRRFVEADFSGAELRECELIGTRIIGSVLVDVEIDAYVQRLSVNGVEVMPLVEAELDRRHPERLALRPTTPAEVAAAVDTVEAFWAPTVALAEAAGASVHQRVDGEWSFVETLRHLVLVHDLWFGGKVLGVDEVHPLGVPAGPVPEPYEEHDLAVVLDLLTSRRDALRAHRASPEDLAAITTILDEEWTHHGFAARDLSRLLEPGARG